MGKCLVTRLQETVNNSDLKELGQVDFYVSKSMSDANQIYIRITSTGQVHVVSDIPITIDSEVKGVNFTIEAGTTTLKPLNGVGLVRISPKYGINNIDLGSAIKIVDVASLNYFTFPLTLTGYKGVTDSWFKGGNLDDLVDMPDYSVVPVPEGGFFRLSSTDDKVKGSIENLKKFKPVVHEQNGAFYLSLGSSDIVGGSSIFAILSNDWKTSLTGISTNQENVGNLSFNLEAFADYVNITDFNLNYIETSGSIATGLGRMTKLKGEIALGNHTSSEDLKTFFDTLYANGKTSGSFVIWVDHQTITYNGTTKPFVNGSTVAFNASGWTYTEPE